MTCNLRHPIGLRHPVSWLYIDTHTYVLYFRRFKQCKMQWPTWKYIYTLIHIHLPCVFHIDTFTYVHAYICWHIHTFSRIQTTQHAVTHLKVYIHIAAYTSACVFHIGKFIYVHAYIYWHIHWHPHICLIYSTIETTQNAVTHLKVYIHIDTYTSALCVWYWHIYICVHAYICWQICQYRHMWHICLICLTIQATWHAYMCLHMCMHTYVNVSISKHTRSICWLYIDTHTYVLYIQRFKQRDPLESIYTHWHVYIRLVCFILTRLHMCMHIYIDTYTYIQEFKLRNMQWPTWKYIYILTHIHLPVCVILTNLHMCMHIYIDTYTYVQGVNQCNMQWPTWTYIYIYIATYTSALCVWYWHIYICACIYISTHTHIFNDSNNATCSAPLENKACRPQYYEHSFIDVGHDSFP